MYRPVYAVGDVQGCLGALLRLQAKLPSQHHLMYCGDVVNRGEDSLGVLRLLVEQNAQIVLGNHDIHLLAVACGVRQFGRRDTIAPIIEAKDKDVLIEWLRFQPLVRHFTVDGDPFLMVHAGVLPCWDLDDILTIARDIEIELQGPHYRAFLEQIFGNTPNIWSSQLNAIERARVGMNAFTRLRYCLPDGAMDFSCNDHPSRAPAPLIPWFKMPERKTKNLTIVSGHWSSLGLLVNDKNIMLDTGCVWGQQLTAYPLNHSRQLSQAVQVKGHKQAPLHYHPISGSSDTS